VWGAISVNVIGEGMSQGGGVYMTRDMRGRFQECISGGMGYRRTFLNTWIVRSGCNVVVVLVGDLGREGGRWHGLGDVIFGLTRLPSRMSIGSTPFPFWPTVISRKELRLTLVALGRSGGGRHLDVLNRRRGRKPVDCPWSFAGTLA
jgi:hypothetical protein